MNFQQSETPIVRFGVLGTGRITRRLVADLQSTDGVSVTAIASRTAERARWHADQYGVPAGVEGYQNLLRRDDVDAVYVALPPSLHAQWAIAAARAGKHVLCEKPLATRVADTLELHQACSQGGMRWLDATGWLHHPRTAAFAAQIAEGRLGTLGHISASVSFYKPFQTGEHRLDASLGGGCLLDLGWYVGGLVRFFSGSLPHRVFADQLIVDGVTQRVTAMLWFEHDLTATLSCGYDTATRKWFEVAGSKASLICDDFTRPWPDRPARYWIHDAAGNVVQEKFEGNQERSLISKLISGDSLAPLQQQALDTQQIVQWIEQSATTGTVVTNTGQTT